MIAILVLAGAVLLALWAMGAAIREREWLEAAGFATAAILFFAMAAGLLALIETTDP